MLLNMWMVFAFLAFLSYCIWGVTNGLVSKHIDPYSGIFFSSIGYLIAGIVSISIGGINFDGFTLNGIMYGVILGLATGLGGLFVLMAIHKGGITSIVVVMTALYPLGTLVFDHMLLGENMSLHKVVGVLLAVVSIILMSI
jgi:uncharacterized membrane protein